MNDVSFVVDPRRTNGEVNERERDEYGDVHDVAVVTILDLEHEQSDGIRCHTHDEIAPRLETKEA